MNQLCVDFNYISHINKFWRFQFNEWIFIILFLLTHFGWSKIQWVDFSQFNICWIFEISVWVDFYYFLILTHFVRFKFQCVIFIFHDLTHFRCLKFQYELIFIIFLILAPLVRFKIQIGFLLFFHLNKLDDWNLTMNGFLLILLI